MELLIEQLPIFIPSLLLGILIIFSHVLLGHEVVRRGIIFMDIAISQIAVLGLLIGAWISKWLLTAKEEVVHHAHSHSHAASANNNLSAEIIEQVFSYGAAIAGALLMLSVQKKAVKTQEAVIGICFILASTGSVIFSSTHPQGAEFLKQAMIGQILWVHNEDVIYTAILTVVFLITWFGLNKSYRQILFYPMFAVMITYSTQLIGVYLVFATLIVPSMASQLYKRNQLAVAYTVAILGYALGIIFSILFDLPAGALIAWTLVIVGALARGFCYLR